MTIKEFNNTHYSKKEIRDAIDNLKINELSLEGEGVYYTGKLVAIIKTEKDWNEHIYWQLFIISFNRYNAAKIEINEQLFKNIIKNEKHRSMNSTYNPRTRLQKAKEIIRSRNHWIENVKLKEQEIEALTKTRDSYAKYVNDYNEELKQLYN